MEAEATIAESSAGVKQLKPLSSSKRKVWKFFGFTVNKSGAITDKKRVVCRMCERRFPYSGNMTNLFCYLQTNHPHEHKEITPKKSTVWIFLQDELIDTGKQGLLFVYFHSYMYICKILSVGLLTTCTLYDCVRK